MAKETRAKAKPGDKRIKNEFWKARSKSGRDKIFATPEDLWEAAVEYFLWADEHPLHKNDSIRNGDKAGELIQTPVDRPLTIEGMCIFFGVPSQTFVNYASNTGEYKDYFVIATQIKEIIRDQKLSGAVIGNYKENIVARMLGMADKKEVSTNMAVVWNETKKYEGENITKSPTDDSGA